VKQTHNGPIGSTPAAASRRRADVLLVERGLFESRAKAQAAIAAGLVTADGAAVRKPSDLIEAGAEIVAEAAHPYVSRGGVKLAAALDAFAVDPVGCLCADIGASTGGFTEVLLARGARRVYAVDVGHGQMHQRLAADPRVVRLERTDIRRVDRALMPEPVDLAVIDVSFISLKLVLPAVFGLLGPAADLVALIKPQFEAGREHVGKGVVRDEAVQCAACDGIDALLREHGFQILGLIASPILGGDGNREFLIGARRG
jgi:23S rRNA (cytidine1920-2'-O)/16S rRNA (cytidine1409-2'-O)-methyltransferase